MGSVRCHVWSSLSCSSDSTTSSSMSAADDAADRLVKIELEAAEALADLAHLAVRESGGGGSSGEWGCKGKRGTKRVKSESPRSDSALNLNPVDSGPICPDLAEDRAVVCQQKCEKIYTIASVEREKVPKQEPNKREMKVEQDELATPIVNCIRGCASFGFRRSRRNLTEAEKEERRIRRVLANRESARQTIRRRQALCEDLTQKAADLTWENENLKREKELALKEYQSLETTNKHLKEQMAKVIKAEEEETPGARNSADVAATTSSSTNCPWLLYNHPPLMPVFWSSFIQSSNCIQSLNGRQSAMVIPSNIPIPATCKPDNCQEKENHLDVNGSRTPFYVLPCPLFFPLPCHGNDLQPRLTVGMKNDQDESSALVENRPCSLPIEVKMETPGSPEARPVNDLNETPVGFPPDGGGQHTGAHSTEIPFTTIKHENKPQPDYDPQSGTPSTACDVAITLPEMKLESATYPSKKLIDVVAAAEARRKRKELTKLKSLHGRQYRMHC